MWGWKEVGLRRHQQKTIFPDVLAEAMWNKKRVGEVQVVDCTFSENSSFKVQVGDDMVTKSSGC